MQSVMKELNVQEERRKISNMFWMLVQTRDIYLHFCRKFISANLLQEITYKIIKLKLSKLTKKNLERIN